MTEEFKPELLPCPFCGSDNLDACFEPGFEPPTFIIDCNDCHGSLPNFDKDECIKLWNTRAPSKCEHEFINPCDPMEI